MTADPAFVAACGRGAQVDALLAAGRPGDAETGHRQALDAMVASGKVDAFLVAKHALGLMYALVFQRKHLVAHAIWIQREPAHAKLWVTCLEAGQMGARDQACYSLVEAYLTSLGTDRAAASQTMKARTRSVLDWAAQHRDAEVCSSALSNWRLHLDEIYERNVPDAEKRELVEAAARSGLAGDFWSPSIWFPRLSAWQVDWTDPDNVSTISPKR